MSFTHLIATKGDGEILGVLSLTRPGELCEMDIPRLKRLICTSEWKPEAAQRYIDEIQFTPSVLQLDRNGECTFKYNTSYYYAAETTLSPINIY